MDEAGSSDGVLRAASAQARRRLRDEPVTRAALLREAYEVAQVGLPSLLSALFSMLQWTYSSHVLGTKFGAVGLTAQSLSMMAGNLIALSILLGFLSACDSLEPQAFAAGRHAEVGRIAVRGFLVGLLLLSPLLPLFAHIDTILISLGQPDEPARLSRRFLRLYAFSFPGLCFVESCVRFYRAQNVVAPLVLVNLLALVLHPLWLHAFVGLFGFDGAPLAHVAGVYLSVLALVLMLRHGSWHAPDTLPEPSWAFLRAVLRPRDLWLLFRLGCPGIFSMAEWWFWEFVAGFAGQFGTASLAAYAIAYSLVPLCFMVPMGLATGITVRVGQLMAEGKVRLAQAVVRHAMAVAMAVVSAVGLAVSLLRTSIVAVFTRDAQVEALSAQVWPLVCSFIVLDGLLGMQTGIIRALSLQAKMSVAVMCSLWLFGVPLMWLLADKMNLQLLGVWISMPIIYVVLDLFMFCSVYFLDWYEVVDRIDAQFGAEPVSPVAAEADLPTIRASTSRRMKAKLSDIPE
jgi:MATE family multidrug resistance protein